MIRDGTTRFEAVERSDELPVGWRETQEPGRYRLEPAGHERCFDVVNGPASLKAELFAAREPLLQIRTLDDGFSSEPIEPDPPPTAVLGLRACDLAALARQDRIFLHDRYPDACYGARRARLLCIGVDCTRSAATCFCTSMETGPEVSGGHDLALTERDEGFLVRAGSAAGAELLEALPTEAAPAAWLDERHAALEACARGMQRRLDTRDFPERLYDRLEHPRWDEVGERCLSCANCTLVCPTCFCHDELDEPALDGSGSVRVRVWDSCFSLDHARVHGLNFRPRTAHRYRQWLVHKLASWIDQFGSSGCVGCGRCITWCPVGIDLTEEVDALLRDPTEEPT